MPFYEYRCERGHIFEVLQRMSDDPVTSCTTCGKPVQRVLQPVAVHFKGSGFYATDYGKKKGAGSAESSSSDGDKAEKKDSEKKDPKKKDSASGSGTSSKSESGASKSSSD